jgi:hypothetical protein
MEIVSIVMIVQYVYENRDVRKIKVAPKCRINSNEVDNMKNIIKGLVVLFLTVAVSACGTPMKNVMRDCDRGQNFTQYTSCIKSTYTSQGRQPNAAEIRAFYANLNAITESYNKNQITDAEAKSQAYNAFLRIIQSANNINAQIWRDAINSSTRKAKRCGYPNGKYTCW